MSAANNPQSKQTKQSWASAFSAFIDRRALIMLFLGFSAGIPILLIFSSLSLWLGEAGISKSAVTMFSWAALGYSFKFVWAPLIDEIPVPYLTKKLGRRRAWLLIAQCLIIVAIAIMAMSNPILGQSALIQMALGAVLLGFSAATQDIVIDAYRIELAEREMQTVLASTYNAGYRIGMIVAGAGALFIAASLGTAKGNYIYEAWQSTYFVMAAVMLIGIVTTLVIREPIVERIDKMYARADYVRLVVVFFCAVASFVAGFIGLGQLLVQIQINDPFLSFALEACRFIGSAIIAFVVGASLVKLGVVNRQMAMETWVAPIADFFKRYGFKLALVLLLLIGFFRISDIIAGVISNIFYQDMNFSKEQIAEAVKIYGVLFSLLGGFLGGLLSQRFNIMKMMFIGAILASSTNLIFIGLVKSGQSLTPVTVKIGEQQYQVNSDEVGYWQIDVPKTVLQQATQIETTIAYRHADMSTQTSLPYLVAQPNQAMQIQLLPVTRDNLINNKDASEKSIVIEGQIAGVDLKKPNLQQDIHVVLDGKHYPVKLEESGHFTTTISGAVLAQASYPHILVHYEYAEGQFIEDEVAYTVDLSASAAELSNHIDSLAYIDGQQDNYLVSGKVIKPYSKYWLYFAIVVDNLASGLAGAVFIAFLSSLTSVSFTAVQYAIFSSLMTLTPKILGGYSGTIVTKIGYPDFFLMTTLIGIPILFLIVWVARLLKQHESAQN